MKWKKFDFRKFEGGCFVNSARPIEHLKQKVIHFTGKNVPTLVFPPILHLSFEEIYINVIVVGENIWSILVLT